ncbi:MAG: SRPBCC domain-containing protein [Leptospirales bacterium]|jgi:uncharacterized protein YndB with AHSA1/START domain
MREILKTNFKKDLENRRMYVTRDFSAPVDRVWRAWTTADLLDRWFAPKPWRAETKSMDFRVGGHWLYCMVGPAGERHWGRIDYRVIDPGISFEADDSFCDENGVRDDQLPAMRWHVAFELEDGVTKVRITITFANLEAMEKIVEMGFEQGFTASNENLDALLAEETQVG